MDERFKPKSPENKSPDLLIDTINSNPDLSAELKDGFIRLIVFLRDEGYSDENIGVILKDTVKAIWERNQAEKNNQSVERKVGKKIKPILRIPNIGEIGEMGPNLEDSIHFNENLSSKMVLSLLSLIGTYRKRGMSDQEIKIALHKYMQGKDTMDRLIDPRTLTQIDKRVERQIKDGEQKIKTPPKTNPQKPN